MLAATCRVVMKAANFSDGGMGRQALQAAGLPVDKTVAEHIDPTRCGVLVGTAFGGFTAFAAGVEALVTVVRPRPSPPTCPALCPHIPGRARRRTIGTRVLNMCVSLSLQIVSSSNVFAEQGHCRLGT